MDKDFEKEALHKIRVTEERLKEEYARITLKAEQIINEAKLRAGAAIKKEVEALDAIRRKRDSRDDAPLVKEDDAPTYTPDSALVDSLATELFSLLIGKEKR